MARGVNKVILVGNLGNDPEVKYTQGGMAIAQFSLATSSSRKDKDGQVVETTEWHRVTAFGKLGEIAGEFLTKGRQVYVEGSIRYRKVEGDNGPKYYTDIIADEIQFLGGGAGEGGGGRSDSGRGASSGRSGGGGGGRQAAPRETTQRETRPRTDVQPMDDFSDDDIPF